MADSLIISNTLELMEDGVVSTDPRFPGAVFYLDRGYDFGAPQPVTAVVASLVVDGERPLGRRASNRTLIIPVQITAPSRDALVAAREVLLKLVDQQKFPIKWTRDGASPVIFDCFRAGPSAINHDVIIEQQLVCSLTLTIPAAPYLRSAVPLPITFKGSQAMDSTAPPDPIILDDYFDVTEQGWSKASANTPTGTAAHWSNPGNGYAYYVSTFPSKNISGMTSLQQWVGTSVTNDKFLPVSSRGKDLQHLTISYELKDSHGAALTFGTSWRKVPGTLRSPSWTLVTVPIPFNSVLLRGGNTAPAIDFTRVVSATIKVSNHLSIAANEIDVFLDNLSAVPPSTPRTEQVSRGLVYTINGIQGTARTSLNLNVAQTFAPTGIAPVYPASFADGYLTLPCNPGYDAKAMTGSVLSLAGSSVFAKIARVPDIGNGTTEAFFQMRYDEQNFLSVGANQGKLFFSLRQSGANTTYRSTSKVQRYWRIREGSQTGPLRSIGYWNFTGMFAAIGSSWRPLASGTTDGDAIILIIVASGAATITVSDTNSNTWNLISSVTLGSGQVQSVFVAPSASALFATSDSILVNSDTSCQFMMTAYTAPGYFDVDVSNTATGTSSFPPSVATGTMGVTNDLEVVAFAPNGLINTNSVPVGWSNAITLNNTNGYNFSPGSSLSNHVFYKKATSTVSDTCTGSYTPPYQWGAIAFALKPRLDSGTVFFDSSADGSSWTKLWSCPHSLGSLLQTMRAYFYTGYYGTERDPGPFLVGGIGVI